MAKQRSPSPSEDIETGMEVETTSGDLGKHDVSAPKVVEVVRDERGNPDHVVVEKGHVFRKRLDVPVERIASVDSQPQPGAHAGEVTIETAKGEVEKLSSVGEESLPPAPAPGSAANEGNTSDDSDDVIEQVQEFLPTAEGLRRLEATSARRRSQRNVPEDGADDQPPDTESGQVSLRSLGPGFLSGMAGNDSSAVTSYSVNGATNGFGQLWLLLLATPLYQAVQYACARVGRVTQKGLGELLRDQYGRPIAMIASLILIIANLALIAADLVAVGTGLELFTGISWKWFILPVAVALWYLTVYQNFGVIKKIFVTMSLVFVAYLITGFLSGARWDLVLKNTFVPQIGLDFATISSAVALLGATVSPYTMYWQVQGEKEERRAGKTGRKLHAAALDILTGTVSGNLVAYFIIVVTASTLFVHHQQITTAADAARSLQPLLGPYAKYLFAIGFVGAGLVAIPVLLASTSYAVSGTFGWPASLWKKPWQNEGFYLILSAALVAGAVVALLGFDPIQLMFWANVLQGILSPVLVVFVLLVGNNKRVMRQYRLGTLTNIGLVLTALVMLAATVLLFVGLFGGHA